AIEAVLDGLGDLVARGELAALLAQPDLQRGDQRPAALVAHALALVRRRAVDLALDREQRVDALDRLDRDRRLVDARQIEELAPRVRPARRLDDRAGLARGRVEPIEPRIGVRLHQAGIARQMLFGM